MNEDEEVPNNPEAEDNSKRESQLLASDLTKYSPNREAPPLSPHPAGQPKQRTFQDLLPEFSTLTTAEVADPKVVGIILGILREKLSEIAILKNDLEIQTKELNNSRAKLIAATTKLRERWKSGPLLQILSALGTLAIGFAFKFSSDQTVFLVLFIAGIVIVVSVAIMTWVVRRDPEE